MVAQSILFAGAAAAVSLLSAVVKAVLARHLGSAAFGSFSFAVSFISLTAMVFEFGIFLPAARLAAKAEGLQRRRIIGAAFVAYIPIGIAYSATVFGSSFVVDDFVNVDASHALRTVAALAAVYPLGLLALWLAQGVDKLHIYSVTVLLGQVLFTASVVVVAAVSRITTPSALVLQALSMLVAWLAFLIWLRPAFAGARQHLRPLVRDTRSFGFQVYIGRLLSIGTYNMDILMVAIWASARQVGLYALAGALAGVIGLPVAGLANALFPRMVHAREIRRQWLGIAWIVGLALACVVWLLAKPFFHHVFSRDYADASRYVLPLALAQVVRGVTGIYNTFLSARGFGKSLRNAGLVLTGSNLILNFALIPPYGAMGAAWASLVALAANLLAHIWFYRRGLAAPDPPAAASSTAGPEIS
jgi:O-antigen/teichoic acid export membrane protein